MVETSPFFGTVRFHFTTECILDVLFFLETGSTACDKLSILFLEAILHERRSRMDSTAQGTSMDGTSRVQSGSRSQFSQFQCLLSLVFGAFSGIRLSGEDQSGSSIGFLEVTRFRCPESGRMECLPILGQGSNCLWLCLAVRHVQFLRVFLLLSASIGYLLRNWFVARHPTMVDFIEQRCQAWGARQKAVRQVINCLSGGNIHYAAKNLVQLSHGHCVEKWMAKLPNCCDL